MSIVPSAERFKNFNNQTSLGFLDTAKADATGMFNDVKNKLDDTKAAVNDFIASAKQKALDSPIGEAWKTAKAVKKELTSLVDSVTRAAKDAFSFLNNLAGMAMSEINSLIDWMIPDDKTLNNLFKSLSNECKKNGLGYGNGFRPFSPSFNCSSGQPGACQSGQVGDLMNRATGGEYGGIMGSLGQMLSKVTALANIGFSASMCKIFASLIKGMPNNVVQRAAASVLAVQGSRGNTSAILDIGASLPFGVNPSLEIAGLVGIAATNFTRPSNYLSQDDVDLMDGYFTAFDSIAPGWGSTTEPGYDGQQFGNIAGLGYPNELLQDSMRTAHSVQAPDMGEWNEPTILTDTQCIRASYSVADNYAAGDDW